MNFVYEFQPLRTQEKIPVNVKKMREKVYFYIMLWAMKRGPLDI